MGKPNANGILFGNDLREEPVITTTVGASPLRLSMHEHCRTCGEQGVYLLGRCTDCAAPILERTRQTYQRHGRGRIGMRKRQGNGPGQRGGAL